MIDETKSVDEITPLTEQPVIATPERLRRAETVLANRTTKSVDEITSLTEQPVIAAPERLRRAETVLANRTSRIVLVLEQCMDSLNHQAVLRTAEALGVQHIWVVNPNERQVKKHKGDGSSVGSKKVTRNCTMWLTIREFISIDECIQALRADERTIWATDLSPDALPMTLEAKTDITLPKKLAVVIGRETDGVSEEMLNAADRRIYFPMHGFTESLNLSVATALIIQRLFDWFPHIRGDVEESEKAIIRSQWYPFLVKNPTQAREAERWKSQSKVIPPLDDLRRPKLGYNDKWIPKKIKARELKMIQVQERSGNK